jgi:hypothetical protein
MRLVLVAAALVFEPIPIAMFLWDLCIFSFLLYDSIMECFFFYDLNGSVVDCAGDNDDSFI